MTDAIATPSADTPELTPEVSGTGNAPKNTFEITADLQPHADAILAMDPVNDVPPPYEFPEGHRWPTPRATALPEDKRIKVQKQLEAFGPEDRPAKEAELTAAAIRSMRAEVRVLTGVGSNATPYHRELVGIAREVRDLGQEYGRLQEELAEVARYETEIDPDTGEPKPVPVYAVTGTRATAALERQDDLLRRIRLLMQDNGSHGIEAKRRLDAALHESAVARKETHRQLQEEAEARQIAQAINRDLRVKSRAESLARLNRNGG